ncbi:MAG: hypothetical protein ACR2QF_07795 [Geminicoccaceae bacterium]
MPAYKDITSKRFGRLVAKRIIAPPGKDRGGYVWYCECDCGGTKDASVAPLMAGVVKSCGCLRSENIKKIAKKNQIHGGHKHPLYGIWRSIISRCTNPNNEAYDNYGGRGVNICDRWRNDFYAFVSDMGPKPSRNHSIERGDNDGPYAPWNCKWATKKTQARNKRNNIVVKWEGQAMILKDAAELAGIPYKTAWKRINQYGWSAEKALSTSIRTLR